MSKFLQKMILGITILVLGVGVIASLVAPFSLLVLLGVILLTIGWLYFGPKLNHLKPKTIKCMVVGVFALMVVGQILVLKFLPSSVYHDPFRVYYQAEQLALQHSDWSDTSYFWRYPNNAVIAILLSWVLKLTHLFGVSTQLTLQGLSILFFDGFIASILSIARKKTNNLPVVQIGIVSFFALLPLSYTYMIKVFYTDSVVLLCLTWIVYLVLDWSRHPKSQRYVNGLLLIILVVIGQLVKPNLIILLIAGLLWALWNLIWHREIFKKEVMVPIVLLTIGFTLTLPIKPLILNSANYQQNAKYELPTGSWIYMGLNSRQHGIYAGDDVHSLLKLENKDARQQALNHKIPERLKTYSLIGFVEHSFIKMAILLSSQPLPTAYTGGHTMAPDWQQKNQAAFAQYIGLVQRILWGSLYSLALLSTIQAFKNIKFGRPGDQLGFVNLSLLGYVALHTLIWETEARYGLVLIPLLFYIIWHNHEYLNQSLSLQKPRLRKIFWWGLPIFIVGMALTAGLGTRKSEEVVTIAQRSQLSKQYHAQPTLLLPGHSLTQQVRVGTKISQFTLQVPLGSQVSAHLVRLDDDRNYPLQYVTTPKGTFMVNSKPLAAGHYRIELKNNTHQAQKIWSVALLDYRLAPYSIQGTQPMPNGSSFIYTFYDQQRRVQL
ncbi:hypothetical protein G7084_01210 [Weissella coleopterorum]|uniref:Glycosyltransferase RgtA/B/C/D-like domain-containing protein n=1 Tax=Weissella coleopterorum TaxID=2714949 RepID=A0A6G8AYH6_9LACO|nr:hypothetical protein [Weissella coleopterorum]QIL50056.1 hypothetical protein G7084_01210 [Weissella coleopterorum]